MNKGTRNRIERQLRNMVNDLHQAKAKQKEPTRQLGTGNIIRRRKGEKDKRFSVSIERRLSAAATG
jgi:RNase P protein component